MSQGVSQGVSQEVSQEASQEASQQVSQKLSQEASQKASQEVTREALQQVPQEASQEVTQETPQDQKSQELPIDWPEHVEYLRRPKVSFNVPAVALKMLNTPTAATATFTRFSADALSFPNPDVRIVPLNDPEHPANGQYGLAAKKHFFPGNFILPYIGRLHTNSPKDTDPESTYDISVDRDLGLSQDASTSGNEARFINDYRGIAERPNAEFRDIWVQTAQRRWERWIGIFVVTPGKSAMRKNGIRPGEEILVSYGKGFWKDRNDEPAPFEKKKWL